MTRMVDCVKLGKRLPGLNYPPFKGELGKRIYENVSEEAWGLWLKHATLLINEYRLNPTEPASQKILKGQVEKFFFGEGAQVPPDYVPPSHGA